MLNYNIQQRYNAPSTPGSQILDLESLPQRFPIPDQQDRHEQERQTDESEQTVAPADTEPFVHSQAEERQERARDGAHGGDCGDGGRGVDGEGVNEVHLQDHE